MADEWITVPNWDKFQHYGNRRSPPWIKCYTALLHKTEYLDLSWADRGLLHGIWLMYAELNGQLRRRDLYAIGAPGRTRNVHRAYVLRALLRLEQAGLTGFCASKPLPLNTHAPVRVREERSGNVRGAEAFIQNGAAAEVPTGQLEDVFREDYHIDDPDLVAELVAKAAGR